MFTVNIPDFDILKIADSGQCFRMKRIESTDILETWLIIAIDKYCYIKADPFKHSYLIDCPNEDNMFWAYYFDLNTDYAHYRNSVDANDAFLSASVEFGTGIRILHQSPWEMLITYIISQRRSIPSIKTCVERLCTKYGHEITKGVYSFPTPEELSRASLEDLSECGLGYRAEYVYLATQGVLTGEINLLSYDNLSDDELVKALKAIKGVGDKVANCVALFGYYRIAAFPIDVWIDRVQKQYYMGRFPVELYEGYAGVMQQYMFYFIRNN